MVSKGTCHRLGDDVNTDYVIASKYRSMGLDFKAMVEHLFEDLDLGLSTRMKAGDFIVAGKNFGCGSSREFAPRVIREAGISVILALSFARIFYRNALNVGLWLLECDTRKISDGDLVEVDLDSWVLKDMTQDLLIPIKPLPPFLLQILRDGGLVLHFRKWRGFHMASEES